MKKTNNRYRNNSSSNTIYSLNYKFDSNSIAGKISGTALDLIKRYNDLAKDALSDNDHVTAEIFRQYAEHYRKIVTEINERKSMRDQQAEANDNSAASAPIPSAEATSQPTEEKNTTEIKPVVTDENVPQLPIKKSFHVIEINSDTAEDKTADTPKEAKPRRTYRRKTVAEA